MIYLFLSIHTYIHAHTHTYTPPLTFGKRIQTTKVDFPQQICLQL